MSENDKKINQSSERWTEPGQAEGKTESRSQSWTPDMEKLADEFVAFLKDGENKNELLEFLKETYKKFEAQKVDQIKARVEKEAEVDANTPVSFHKPGNITTILDEDLNMQSTEMAFAMALKSTKANLQRSVEDRVEEVNRLLAGIGGFSSQLKSCFARSTVVFLEQDDSRYQFRERLTFTIHLPSYELKDSWRRDSSAIRSGKIIMIKDRSSTNAEDRRTALQVTWDDAVNALAKIIEGSGLRPKYCKNDRNYGRFVMKQDLRSSSNLPDEYFSITLDYHTEEKIKEMCSSYNQILKNYEKKILKLAKSLSLYSENSASLRYQSLKRKYLELCQERDLFIGTVPDPNQIEEGLMLFIEVSSLKDYHVVKDRMQNSMTKFILHLSTIAVREASKDPNMEYDIWKSGGKAPLSAEEQNEPIVLTKEDIEGMKEYTVKEEDLHLLLGKKKKAA
jgi:hypothetical protein